MHPEKVHMLKWRVFELDLFKLEFVLQVQFQQQNLKITANFEEVTRTLHINLKGLP